MDHRISKDMISSGMIPSGEKKQEDLSRTQYGTAPSPSALSDVYKSMYEKKEETLNEHHKKDADGNTIPHEDEEVNERKIPAGLQAYLDKKKGKKEDKKEMKEGNQRDTESSKKDRTQSNQPDPSKDGFTEVLLDNLKDTFPSVNFIGIRLLPSRDAGSFIRRYHGWTDEEYNKIMKGWKKNRSVSIKTSAYDTYFGLSTTALATEDEFEVKEDATKAEIKRAFGKSLKGKKMNKKILSEFIDLVV